MNVNHGRMLWGGVLAVVCPVTGARTHPEGKVIVATVQPRGAVEVRGAADETWRSLSPERRLQPGDLLKTSEAGTSVVLSGTCRLQLNADTVVQLRDDAFALFAGELLVSVSHATAAVTVRTPGTTTTSLGGVFSVALIDKGARVTVVAGTAMVESGDSTRLVGEGRQTTAAAGTVPAPPTEVDARAIVAWAQLDDGRVGEVSTKAVALPETATVAALTPKRSAPSRTAAQGAETATTTLATPADPPAAAATRSPEGAPGIPGVAFAALPDAKGNTFPRDAAALTFLVTLDYGKDAPTELTLRTALVDADGKTAAQREDALADASRRYRVKRVVFDRLPAGEYVGRFTLLAAEQRSVVETKFTVQ